MNFNYFSIIIGFIDHIIVNYDLAINLIIKFS